MDEIWTTKDGTKIAVADMDEEHVRNVLRMLLRKARLKRERRIQQALPEMTVGEIQDELSAVAYSQLKNPDAYFPLLDGGVYGSQSLFEKYGRGR